MNPALWRAVMLALIFVAAAFVAFGNFVQIQRDDLGIVSLPSVTPHRIHVLGVEPGSPAAAAGIRKGDYVALTGSSIDHLDFSFPTPGVRIPVTVNGTRRVTLVAGRAQAVPFTNALEFKLVRLAYLLVAALLAWRRPDDRSARALVTFLFALGFAIALNNNAFGSPILSFVVLQLLSVCLLLYAMGAGARFAAIFPTGQAPPAARAMATVATVVTWLGIAAFLTVSLTLGLVPPNLAAIGAAGVFGGFMIALALLLATLVERYVHAPPSERKRRLWIFLILGVGLLGPTIDLLVGLFAGFNHVVDQYSTLTLMLIPIGLGYIILRHRVIDVGFVLNRAAVYALMSIVIVGVFVVVETLLAKYVEITNHVTSTAVQLAVALLLGFSIRAIHSRVDRFIDTVLFRERHEAEAAIRTFAHDAPYITDGNVLGERCVEITMRYAHAVAAGLWIRSEAGAYEPQHATFMQARPVGADDPAIVAMRARRVVVDVHDAGSGLPGSLAFPMIVRGELVGTLVCGAKAEDETYAPDERAALEVMATAVGHAYDALRIRDLRERVEMLERGSPTPGIATGGALGTF